MGSCVLIRYSFLLFLVLSACLNKESNNSAKKLALKELRPYLRQVQRLKNSGVLRKTANINSAVFLIDQKNKRYETPSLSLQGLNGKTLSRDLIEEAANFTSKQLVENDLKDTRSNLQFVRRQILGKRVILRFRQVMGSKFRDENFIVPIKGAQALVFFEEGKLKKIKSSVVKFNFSYSIFYKTGLEFLLSDKEFNRFMYAVKLNDKAREIFKKSLLRYSKGIVDFDEFLNRQVSEQRRILNMVYKNIGRLELFKIIADAGKKGKLKFARHGLIWKFEVSNFLDLPLSLDLVLGEATDFSLKVMNLRENFKKAINLRVFESPYYPGKKDQKENSEQALKAKSHLKKAIDYFDEKFGWKTYKGPQSTPQDLEVHTGLKSIDFRENAAWVGSIEQILVGEDGATVKGIYDSLSILSHEYSHAVVEFSSGLKYEEQAGAIDEHFADFMGATVEANHNESFKYSIGADVLGSDVRTNKEKLLDLIFKQSPYTDEQKDSFFLREVSMRQFYAPELSFTSQYKSMKDVEGFYKDCVPSYDNDNCGVHTASGILNRAIALLVSVEGLEKVVPIVFKTVAYKLLEDASFEDYVIGLNETCVETHGEAEICDIILASFARVDVFHPGFPLENLPEEERTGELPLAQVPTTPELTLCGWVQKVDEKNYRIFDNKFNALLIDRNFAVKTEGDYASVLSKSDCACVKGYITQQKNADKETQNIFLRTTRVFDRGSKCSQDPDIKDIKPKKKIRFEFKANHFQKPLNYCGWVSVNSRSRNVTIIDNQFDAAILASGYSNLSKGRYADVYKHECACVRGTLGETANSKGMVFNFFKEVNRIRKRPKEACIGLEWK